MMITAFLFWLYKKYSAYAHRNYSYYKARNKALKFTGKTIAFLMIPLLAFSEERTSTYAITYNDHRIGELVFNRMISGPDTYLKMQSSVKTRFILGIKIKTIDQAHFNKGMLISSSVYRSVNGREKENKKTCLVDNGYHTRSGSVSGRFGREITYNMMMLYYQEPINRTEIYSDNFQQFLAIKPVGKHAYRIDLPDGNHNNYYFQNGVCTLIELHQAMYTVKMELQV